MAEVGERQGSDNLESLLSNQASEGFSKLSKQQTLIHDKEESSELYNLDDLIMLS